MTGCSKAPDVSKVKDDFTAKYPRYSVRTVELTQIDDGAAYFIIRYEKPDDKTVYEDEWGYGNWELDSNGRWHIFYQKTKNGSRSLSP